MTTKLLTLKEAAERLRTTPTALKKRFMRGEVDHIKDGRRVLMTERQIEEHIAACRIFKRKKRTTPHPPG